MGNGGSISSGRSSQQSVAATPQPPQLSSAEPHDSFEDDEVKRLRSRALLLEEMCGLLREGRSWDEPVEVELALPMGMSISRSGIVGAIHEGGNAMKSGRISVGDVVVSVDGVDLRQGAVWLGDALDMSRTVHTVRLERVGDVGQLRHRSVILEEMCALLSEGRVWGPPFQVQLRHPFGIGVSRAGIVGEIYAGGNAELSGMIQPGDLILKVDGAALRQGKLWLGDALDTSRQEHVIELQRLRSLSRASSDSSISNEVTERSTEVLALRAEVEALREQLDLAMTTPVHASIEEAAAAVEAALKDGSIDFNIGSWSIEDREDNRRILAAIASALIKHPAAYLHIHGVQNGVYTPDERWRRRFAADFPGELIDERASTSQGRVLACKQWLVRLGVEDRRIRITTEVSDIRRIDFRVESRAQAKERRWASSTLQLSPSLDMLFEGSWGDEPANGGRGGNALSEAWADADHDAQVRQASRALVAAVKGLSITFEQDSWHIGDRQEILEAVASVMRRYPSVHLQVHGVQEGVVAPDDPLRQKFAAEFGSAIWMDERASMAQARALACWQRLAELGVEKARMQTTVEISNQRCVEFALVSQVEAEAVRAPPPQPPPISRQLEDASKAVAAALSRRAIEFNASSWQVDDRTDNSKVLAAVAIALKRNPAVHIHIHCVQPRTHTSDAKERDAFAVEFGEKHPQERAVLARGRGLACVTRLQGLGIDARRVRVTAGFGERQRLEMVVMLPAQKNGGREKNGMDFASGRSESLTTPVHCESWSATPSTRHTGHQGDSTDQRTRPVKLQREDSDIAATIESARLRDEKAMADAMIEIAKRREEKLMALGRTSRPAMDAKGWPYAESMEPSIDVAKRAGAASMSARGRGGGFDVTLDGESALMPEYFNVTARNPELKEKETARVVELDSFRRLTEGSAVVVRAPQDSARIPEGESSRTNLRESERAVVVPRRMDSARRRARGALLAAADRRREEDEMWLNEKRREQEEAIVAAAQMQSARRRARGALLAAASEELTMREEQEESLRQRIRLETEESMAAEAQMESARRRARGALLTAASEELAMREEQKEAGRLKARLEKEEAMLAAARMESARRQEESGFMAAASNASLSEGKEHDRLKECARREKEHALLAVAQLESARRKSEQELLDVATIETARRRDQVHASGAMVSDKRSHEGRLLATTAKGSARCEEVQASAFDRGAEDERERAKQVVLGSARHRAESVGMVATAQESSTYREAPAQARSCSAGPRLTAAASQTRATTPRRPKANALNFNGQGRLVGADVRNPSRVGPESSEEAAVQRAVASVRPFASSAEGSRRPDAEEEPPTSSRTTAPEEPLSLASVELSGVDITTQASVRRPQARDQAAANQAPKPLPVEVERVAAYSDFHQIPEHEDQVRPTFMPVPVSAQWVGVRCGSKSSPSLTSKVERSEASCDARYREAIPSEDARQHEVRLCTEMMHRFLGIGPDVKPQKRRMLVFQGNSSNIDDGSENLMILAEIARILNAHPNTRMLVRGETDNRARVDLARVRAKACLDRLVAAGIEPSRLQSVGRVGKWRRVEFVVRA